MKAKFRPKRRQSLQAAHSAGQIGADAFTNVTGGTVQEQLQSIQKNLEDYRREVKENGAENVGMTPFDGVTANTVQAALEQLQANLVRYINAVKSAEGAGRVGITPFKGVTSVTVQAALEEIRRQIDDVTAGIIPDYGVTTIKLALQAVTADRLAQDVLDMIEAAEPARSTNELDDYTMETGFFINAGAGWNTFKFRHPFEGVPVVTVTPKEFSGFCEIKNVSKEGFLYCVRKPQLQDDRDRLYRLGYGHFAQSQQGHLCFRCDAAAGRSADARHDYNGREDRNGLYRY